MIFLSCGKHEKEDTDLIIDLELKVGDNPVGSMQRPFYFLDSIPKHFSGLINKDSSFVGYIGTINLEEYDRLRKEKRIPELNLDSIRTGIYCLSGYNNGKQFYILDSNGNYDFSDEEITEFDKSIAHQTKTDEEIRNSFPIHKMKVNKLDDHGVYGDSIYISLYPNIDYFTYGNPSATNKEELKRKLLVVGRFIDYSFGTFSLLDKKYKVALGKYGFKGINMIFSEYDRAFLKHNEIGREEYLVLDTLKLAQSYYRIDEFDRDSSKLKLTKLQVEDPMYGFRKGSTIHNYLLEDLDGYKVALKNLFKGKQMVLLDFWGTWCAPCKELTPDLVALNNEYKDKVSLVSLAYEKDPIPVKEYVDKNGMEWFNGIIKGTPKSGNNDSNILSDLRITGYPTFIILDSDLKILFRGDGNTFKEIEPFLNK